MRMIACLLIVLLASPALAWDREGFKRDVAWVTGMHGADLISTHYMLEAGRTELNPVMRQNALTKKILGTAVTVGLLYAARRLGNDRVAIWVRWGIVAVLGAVTTWNSYLAVR